MVRRGRADAAMYGEVLARRKLLVTLCFFCRCATRICWPEVEDDADDGGDGSLEVHLTSDTKRIPTPTSTMTMALMTSLPNFCP